MALAVLDRWLLTGSASGAWQVAESGEQRAVPARRPRLLKVSASTQNQALAALLFLYGEVFDSRLPWLDEIVRASRPRHLPVVLSRVEVCAVLEQLSGTPQLMAFLLYGPAFGYWNVRACA